MTRLILALALWAGFCISGSAQEEQFQGWVYFNDGDPSPNYQVITDQATLDLSLDDGLLEIPIEERSPRELSHVTGRDGAGQLVEVQLLPDGSAAANPAFDVTPARLVTGLITERGVVATDERTLRALAP